MPELVGTLTRLNRYPIKSVGGEDCTSLHIGYPGVVGDRRIVVYDELSEHVLTAKAAHGRDLLLANAWIDGSTLVTLPGLDSPLDCDNLPLLGYTLSGLLDRRVRPVRVADCSGPLPTNFGFSLMAAVGYDQRPVHILTSASLSAFAMMHSVPGQVAAMRYRPNLLIQTPPHFSGFVEDSWVGRVLVFPSGLRLRITALTGRCSLPTQAQPRFGLTKQHSLGTTLKTQHDGKLGVYAIIEDPGAEVVELEDAVYLD